MEKYKVVLDEGVLLEAAGDTVHPKDTVLELDPETEETKVLLEKKAIELLPTDEQGGGEKTPEEVQAEADAAAAKAEEDAKAAAEKEAADAEAAEVAEAEAAAHAEADASEASAAATAPGESTPPAPERHPLA